MNTAIQSGLAYTNVIDAIAHDSKTDEIALIMMESRSWNGSDKRLFQLQEKINTYLAFALDGEMVEAYPDFAGKKVRLQLDCVTLPDPRTMEFIQMIQEQIAYQDIKFIISLPEQATCGSSCECDS